jgi:hypothetical protein
MICSMAYFVHGFRSGTFDNGRLGIAALRQKASKSPNGVRRIMEAYGVVSPGLFLLQERFGEEYQHFVVLDEVAVEACETLGFNSGTQLGPVDIDELRGSVNRLFKTDFWT